MKLKFVFLTLLLFFARGCDFYSTSLWFFQPDGKSGEMNPLTRFFNAGWSGLILTNILIVGFIVTLLYYYYFRYKRQFTFSTQPRNYLELASLQYFNSSNKFHEIFYKLPANKSVLLAHMGYVLTITIIIGSFIATFHNFCQFYSLEFYNRFRDIVGRPLFVIYGLLILTMAVTYRQLLVKEYKKYKLAAKTGIAALGA